MKKISLFIFAMMMGLLFFNSAFASEGSDLGSLAENVIATLSSLAKLITAVAYIAGLGFAVGAVLKFKQHKDNPTQIPIGTPVALLFVAAALIFLPTIFSLVGSTLFKEGKVGGPSGVIFRGIGEYDDGE